LTEPTLLEMYGRERVSMAAETANCEEGCAARQESSVSASSLDTLSQGCVASEKIECDSAGYDECDYEELTGIGFPFAQRCR
jgi:hypothetical protein